MKIRIILPPLLMGIGVGTAVSVAVQNALVGIGIRVAVGTVFGFVNSKGKTVSKHLGLPLLITLWGISVAYFSRRCQ